MSRADPSPTPLVELPLDEHLGQSLLEEVPDGLMIADEDGRIRLVNHGLEEMFGYNRAEILGQRVEILVPDAVRARHGAHRLRYRAAPHRRPMGIGMDLEGRRKDGTNFPVEISLSPITAGDETLTIATIRDVSERRAAEREVQWVQRLLDATSDAVYVFTPDTLQFLHVNVGACHQTGYSHDQLFGMGPLHVLPALPERRLRAVLEPLTLGSSRPVEFETEVRRADGSDVPVEVICELIQPDPNRPPAYVATARDISERQVAQQALAETRHRLVVSEERERIARDLHDKVIQRLFATGLGLQAAAGQVGAEPVLERLHTAIEDLDQAIRDIRTSIFALHAPVRSNEGGLRNGVLDKTNEAARVLGFAPTVHFNGPVDAVATADITEALLATLQEALSNVARHAQATMVQVELHVDDGVRLRVRDNGTGLRGSPDGAGQGLRNIRERAAALGGTTRIDGAEPSGTEIEWWVPRT